VAQGQFEFFDLQATTPTRNIKVNGTSGGLVTGSVAQAVLSDVVIEENGTTITFESGSLQVGFEESGSISPLILNAEIVFEQFPNTIYTVGISSINPESSNCLGSGGLSISNDNGNSIFTSASSGDNFTIEIGGNIETVNCSEIPRLLNN